MEWTKLNLTKVLDLYKDREYHNLDHLAEMYNYLNTQEIEYSPILDYAILFHDAVYDNLPDKELRSADLFDKCSLVLPLTKNDIYHVKLLIRCTINHKIILKSKLENNIIQADLCGLLDIDTAIVNREKIKEESKRLYGITDKIFYEKNKEFMNKLLTTMLHNISESYYDEDKEFYSDVARTIVKLNNI